MAQAQPSGSSSSPAPPADHASDVENAVADPVASPSKATPKTKEKAAPSSPAKRQRGVPLLPTSRIQRIIKADRDVDICSREATFLIATAAEIFLKKFTEEAYTNAKLDKRKVVSYKDFSKAVQQNDFLEFLKEAVPTPLTLSAALAERQAKMAQRAEMEAAILAGTLPDEDEDGDEGEGEGEADGGEGEGEVEVEGEGEGDDDDGAKAGGDDDAMGDAEPPRAQRPAKKVKAKSRSKGTKAAGRQSAAADDDATEVEAPPPPAAQDDEEMPAEAA